MNPWLKISSAVLFISAGMLVRAETLTAAQQSQDITINWSKGRLSAVANGASLSQILTKISARTGIEVHGSELLTEKVQVHVSRLPLREALLTLLSNVNYTLVETSAEGKNRPPMVLIISGQVAGTTPQEKRILRDETTLTNLLANAGYVPKKYIGLYDLAAQGKVDTLGEAVDRGDNTTQAIALQLLAQEAPEKATHLAVDAARNAEPKRRVNALNALADLDNPEATEALGAALTDADLSVRFSAVNGLRSQSSPAVVDYLTRALEDRDPSIRRLALDLLARRGEPGTAGIRLALSDSDPSISDHANDLLKQLEGDE